MSQHICQNPECERVYDDSDKDTDLSTCSFQCWEKLNCKVPILDEIGEPFLVEKG